MLLGTALSIMVGGCGDTPHREVEIEPTIVNSGPYDRAAAIWILSSSLRVYVQPTVEPVHEEVDALLPVQVPLGEAQAEWLRGYRDGGGQPQWEATFINNVIRCESRWQLEPGNPYYLGAPQWDPGTWDSINRAIGPLELYSWYDQGRAMAYWSNRTNPAGKGGWLGTWYGC